LGALGEDRAPAFQAAANATAVDHGRVEGMPGQFGPDLVGPAEMAETELGGHPFEPDGVDPPVVALNVLACPVGIAVATNAANPDLLSKEWPGGDLVSPVAVKDKYLFHRQTAVLVSLVLRDRLR
jgi:hypothetical protein